MNAVLRLKKLEEELSGNCGEEKKENQGKKMFFVLFFDSSSISYKWP